MPRTLSPRSQEIIAAITHEIEGNHISSFSYQETPEPGKLIVFLFEMHFDPIPNFLTRLIADIVKANAVAIEQPVEHTAALESMLLRDLEMSINPTEGEIILMMNIKVMMSKVSMKRSQLTSKLWKNWSNCQIVQ